MTNLRAVGATAILALIAATSLGGCAVERVSSGETDPVVTEQPAGKVRAPEAVGTITAVHLTDPGGPVSVAFTPDAGYEYYAGTTFQVSPSMLPNGEDGVTMNMSDLVAGAHINVWVDACRESSPVDCDVVRVELAP